MNELPHVLASEDFKRKMRELAHFTDMSVFTAQRQEELEDS